MSQQLQDLYKRFVHSEDSPPEYGLIYFDHIASEYQVLRPSINDEARDLLDKIVEKRTTDKLDWKDIYTFDLVLLEYLPPEYLVRKAFTLRARYRNIAGQLAYDAYILSKPPDIGALRMDEIASPPTLGELNELELKADIRFLLGEFHLLYAVMPARESLRGFLIKRTLYALTPVLLLGFLFLFIGTVGSLLGSGWWIGRVAQHFQPTTLGVVAFVGVIGGFLSVLQRIQSSPSEGDAIYNLAAITHGTWSIYLSPFSGGIFALLLYVIFAAGILQGTIIPDLTSENNQNATTNNAGNTNAAATPTPQQGTTSGGGTNTNNQNTNNQNTNNQSNAAATNNAGNTNATAAATPTPPQGTTGGTNANNQNANNQNANNQSNAAASAPSPPGKALSLKDFLTQTGPSNTTHYALLVLWSFLAGFAERLVPDTLNRLVTKQANQSGQT
jgi:hypothetical protein